MGIKWYLIKDRLINLTNLEIIEHKDSKSIFFHGLNYKYETIYETIEDREKEFNNITKYLMNEQ